MKPLQSAPACVSYHCSRRVRFVVMIDPCQCDEIAVAFACTRRHLVDAMYATRHLGTIRRVKKLAEIDPDDLEAR
jgi:hypothetical protein